MLKIGYGAIPSRSFLAGRRGVRLFLQTQVCSDSLDKNAEGKARGIGLQRNL
jgi:hypothetical protein